MSMDQLCIAEFLRQKIRCPAGIILMKKHADPAPFDPILKILFIVFDIVIKTILFDQDNVISFQIVFLGIINFFRLNSQIMKEIFQLVSGLEPVGKKPILKFIFIFPFSYPNEVIF